MGLIGATKPKEYCLDLLRFHAWRAGKIKGAMHQIDQSLWSKPLDGSFGSLEMLINHMAWAEMLWLNKVQGKEDPPVPTLKGEAIFEAWEEVTGEWIRTLEAKRNEDFHQIFHFQDTNGDSYKNSLFEIVVHFIDHGSYHTGQAMNTVVTFGHHPGSTDYIDFLRAKA